MNYILYIKYFINGTEPSQAKRRKFPLLRSSPSPDSITIFFTEKVLQPQQEQEEGRAEAAGHHAPPHLPHLLRLTRQLRSQDILLHRARWSHQRVQVQRLQKHQEGKSLIMKIPHTTQHLFHISITRREKFEVLSLIYSRH